MTGSGWLSFFELDSDSPDPQPHPPPIPFSLSLLHSKARFYRIAGGSCHNSDLRRSMGSSHRLFGRQRSVHEVIGGGFVADVLLWRRRNVTIGTMLGTLAAWVVFELSGYIMLSLVSSVLLLFISILFVWAKSAALLNRPPPPIPWLHLSEEVINEAAAFVHSHVNAVLSSFHEVALGKDSKLFYKVAACLWVISIVGSWTDFPTLSCTSLLVVLTIPVLYEKYEDNIDRYVMSAYVEMLQYERIYEEWFRRVKNWILEKKKEVQLIMFTLIVIY